MDGEIGTDELSVLFPVCKIAKIPAAILRREGYAIGRRPAEAPENCSNPEAHVVTGPIVPLDRGRHERAARHIVKHPAIHVLTLSAN